MLEVLPAGASRFLRDIGIPRPDRLDLELALTVRGDGWVTLYRVSGLPTLTWCIAPGDERVMQLDDSSNDLCVVNSSLERMVEFLTISELLSRERYADDFAAARALVDAALNSERPALGDEFYFWVEWFDVYFEEAEMYGVHAQ